ncbi:MAG: IS110 family transposase [Actinopolymorphaceae bacterium]
MNKGVPVALRVGIDVAKDLHWVVAVTDDGQALLNRKLENTPSAIEELLDALGRLGRRPGLPRCRWKSM